MERGLGKALLMWHFNQQLRDEKEGSVGSSGGRMSQVEGRASAKVLKARSITK